MNIDESDGLRAAVHSVMNEASIRAIMPRYRRLVTSEIREKSPDELVTIADLDCEAILTEGLKKILPHAAVVGEEGVGADPSLLSELGNALCWIIDPLDGTANFVAGNGPFGILVALAEHGVPIGGWILDPRTGRFVAAFRGQGTYVDGMRAFCNARGKDLPVAAVSALLAGAPDRAPMIERIRSQFATVPIPRCAAEQYPAMIAGQSDIAVFERTLPWDHAAGVLCLTEAGGMATRFDGSAYRVDDQQSGLIAAVTPSLWNQFQATCSFEADKTANPVDTRPARKSAA